MTLLEHYLIAGALLMILSVVTSKATGFIGIPSLLVFLAIGMLAGSEGFGKIYFDNAAHAQTLGVVALIYILFAGGLGTELKKIKPVIFQGTSLGSIGVIITCAITGAACKYILNFSWLEGLLLGSIVSSTDASAVFTVLREKNTAFKGKIQELLEFESGANDPMAVILTVGILQLLTHKIESPLSLIPDFFIEMAIGGVIGWAAGKSFPLILNRLKLNAEGLYPVIMLAFVMLTYGVTQSLHGSGFLAVYLAGLLFGSEKFVHKKSLILFHDGIAWLMQILMFLALGLLVYPSRLIPVIGNGFLISAVLILIARPIAVFISLSRSKFSIREKAMISWVGLRGSVPIILATYPLLAGIEKADSIFNLVFFIVITSILIQGSSIPMIAKLLKVRAPVEEKSQFPIEYFPSQNMKSDLVELEIHAGTFAEGKAVIDLGLPQEALIVLVQRKGNILVPRGATSLESGDKLLMLSEKNQLPELKQILKSGPIQA